MSYAYDASYPLAFPVLPVVLRQIDGDASTMLLSALVDSGADVTIVPVGYLRAIGAEEIYSAHLRAHWGVGSDALTKAAVIDEDASYVSVKSTVGRVLRRRGIRGEAFEFLRRRLMQQAEAMYEEWPMVA